MTLKFEQSAVEVADTDCKIEIASALKELGDEYWKEQLKIFHNDPKNPAYIQFRNALVDQMKRCTGAGGNAALYTGGFGVSERYINEHNGELSDRDRKKLAGRRVIAAEHGLQVGPYEVDAHAATAVSDVTDVVCLQRLVDKSSGRATVKLERAETLELMHLLERAAKDLEATTKDNALFKKLTNLAAEWQTKFPGESLYSAVVSDPAAIDVRKEKRGALPVIIAPEALAELFTIKLDIDRAKQKLISRRPDIELDAQKLPGVIKKMWKFIRDTEEALYPDGYYLVNWEGKSK